MKTHAKPPKFLHFFHLVIPCCTCLLLLPSLSFASSEGSAQFFVAAWLVRIWLALVCGTVIVVGVMLALDGWEPNPRLEPERTAKGEVVLRKQYRLSYRKIGGGLLCVVFGGLLFVTTVFLLPDKRTGHSGIHEIITHFSQTQTPGTARMHETEQTPPGNH